MWVLSRAVVFVVMPLMLASLPAAVHAQQRDTIASNDSTSGQTGARALESVRVNVTRDAARSPFDLPFSLVQAPVGARPEQRRSGVGDLLLGVPGVQVQDRANPSQDPRIAVRGFGARSAFGVRGVRLLRDGVPVSLPDGQTPVDWLDLETVDRIDVIRGTAAALYGNAAGGVIDLRSRAPSSAPFAANVRYWNGGGFERANVTLSGSSSDHDGSWREGQWLGSFTRTAGEGPRTWSRLDATSLFLRGLVSIGGTSVEMQGTRYDAPRAENTGALTAVELAHDPRLPDSLNIIKKSLKAARQTQVALIARRILKSGIGDGELRASVFAGTRSLDNPLPFAIVAIERSVRGANVHGTWRTESTWLPLRAGAGIDVQQQMDDRYNYENCSDVAPFSPLSVRCPTRDERGATRLDQQELAAGIGSYARGEVEFPQHVFASAAVRLDAVRFRVRDRFVNGANRDDSGERRLGAVSPMFGLTWRARPFWSVYANMSSAFETPTVTELTNQADGAAGLNASLEPQRTRTIELGTQGILADRMRIEAVVFRATVLDELVPFDVPDQPGRRAFRNAGRTSREGAEASLRVVGSHLDFGTAYTWSHFRFHRYDVGSVSYAGNPIPGVPEHYWQSFATGRVASFWSTIELTAASRASATDAATVFASGYAVWNVRAGTDPVRLSRRRAAGVRVAPSIGIDNLFNRYYAGSLAVNATRNRYFEPGQPLRITFALRLNWE